MNQIGSSSIGLQTATTAAVGADQDAGGGDRFLRHLGVAERLFYLYGERSNVNFSLVAEIEGSIRSEAIAPAIRQVIDRHPLLSASIGFGPAGHLAFLRNGILPHADVHHVAREEWPTYAATDVNRPLGKRGAAFFRATILLEANAAAVIMTFHHAVANGRSAVSVLKDLLSALAGRTLAATMLPFSLEGYAGYEETLSDYERPVERPAILDAFEPALSSADLHVAKLLIGQNETEALLAMSRAHGATLHGTLCAALAVLRARQSSTAEVRVLSAVDLRETVGAPDGVCAFLNGAMLTPVAGEQNFWENARSISAAARAYREPDAVRDAVRAFAAMLPAHASASHAAAILEGPLSADVEVTNLGASTMDLHHGNLRTTALWGPIPSPKIEGVPVVGIIGFGGMLHITQGHLGATDELLNRLHAFLREEVLAGSAAPT